MNQEYTSQSLAAVCFLSCDITYTGIELPIPKAEKEHFSSPCGNSSLSLIH